MRRRQGGEGCEEEDVGRGWDEEDLRRKMRGRGCEEDVRRGM